MDPISQAIEAVEAIVPNRPGDSLNAPLVRRLDLLLQAATAIADAIPDNGGLSVADAVELTAQARAAAARIDAKTWAALTAPQGFSLPRCSEVAAERL
jgi:hypothetical protein